MESIPILLAQLLCTLSTWLAQPAFLLGACLLAVFNPTIFYLIENNAERSYFLSFKNNGVMLCGFFRNLSLVLR